MSVIVLTSAGGAPGTTTTALGLSLEWPRDVLLADCDRDPSQAVLAGFFGGVDPGGLGLPALAHAHREGRPLQADLARATLPLVVDTAPRRHFLPGFATPSGGDLFAPVWPALMDAFHEISRAGTDVIIDAGRIGRAGLPDVFVSRSDVILVCCETSLRALACLRLYLPRLQDSVRQWNTRLGLLLVGDGRPYSAGEITTQFGVPVYTTVVHDPASAAVFSEGAAPSRKFSDSPYRRSVVAAATQISIEMHERLRLVRGGAA